MVFASFFLMFAYVGFMCLSYAIAVVLPVMFVILAVLSLIAFAVLAVVWFRLKKKGWFSKDYQTAKLSENGGYWKVIGIKAIRVGLIVLMILSGISLAVSVLFTAIIYL